MTISPSLLTSGSISLYRYLLSFLDRTNIGNARLAGMETELDMAGHDYNLSLTIFFVCYQTQPCFLPLLTLTCHQISYALAEPITNVMLKRLTPRIFFTGIIVAWGIIMTLMGLVTNFPGLLAARWFLGLAEAGLFPGTFTDTTPTSPMKLEKRGVRP